LPANSIARALAAYIAAHDGAGANEFNGNAAVINALLRDALGSAVGNNDIRKAKTLEDIKNKLKESVEPGTNRVAAAGGLAGAAGGQGDARPHTGGFAGILDGTTVGGLANGLTAVQLGAAIDAAFADHSVLSAYFKKNDVINAIVANHDVNAEDTAISTDLFKAETSTYLDNAFN